MLLQDGSYILNFGIPRGKNGTGSNPNDPTPVAKVSLGIGTVTTVNSSDDAKANLAQQNDGSYLLNLSIPRGEQGPKGDTGATGQQGQQGPKGDTGATGKSAYQIWLDNDHTGTEQDFLNSLKGQKGDTGAKGDQGPIGQKGDTGATGPTGAQGPIGATGADGKSAYQVWLDAGNSGSETDFLNSLKGKSPVRGQDYWTQADQDAIKQWVEDAILNGKW